MQSLSRGAPVLLVANMIYGIPSEANQLSWQSVGGADLQGSLDGSAFSSLAGVSAANEIKNLLTATKFVRCSAADMTVVTNRLASSYTARIVADGASNLWRLNETSGLKAVDLIGGVNGTISGGVTLNQSGALADGDKAMTFDGTTGQIGTAVNVTLVPPFTIELWVNTSAVTDKTACETAAGSGDYFQLRMSLGKFRIQTYPSTGNTDLAGIRSINDSRWHHLVGVFQAGLMTGYVDGTMEMSGPPSATLVGTTTRPLMIANSVAFGLNQWSGSLDEVAIYPVALTPAQIANHYKFHA